MSGRLGRIILVAGGSSHLLERSVIRQGCGRPDAHVLEDHGEDLDKSDPRQFKNSVWCDNHSQMEEKFS